MQKKRILVIQTAFIGDTILMTSFLEKLRDVYGETDIHILIRKGHEDIFKNNPLVNKIWSWDKRHNKFIQLLKIILKLRHYRFDFVFNLHRYFSSGLVSFLIKAKKKIGFNKNPFSLFYSKAVRHKIPDYRDDRKFLHEVQRNYELIRAVETHLEFLDSSALKPKVYFKVHEYKLENYGIKKKYICLSPKSVWKTKEWHKDGWLQLLALLEKTPYQIIFLGSKGEESYSKNLIELSHTKPEFKDNCLLLHGLSLHEVAFILFGAERLFVNDSGLLHLASSVNCPTTAIFCSTVEDFGFYPLALKSNVVDVKNLECRPCSLHGLTSCPKGHFRCSKDIQAKSVYQTLKNTHL